MSYIGNQVTSIPHVIDAFSGNGVTTSFGPLVRAPAGVAAIAVFISGSYKTPGADYTLNGTTITFSVAPAAGSSNIIIHHLGNGSASQVPSDGSVTGPKITVGAVSGNNIVDNAIRGNNIVAGTISGNLLSDGAISANQFSSSANAKITSSGIVGSIIFGGS